MGWRMRACPVRTTMRSDAPRRRDYPIYARYTNHEPGAWVRGPAEAPLHAQVGEPAEEGGTERTWSWRHRRPRVPGRAGARGPRPGPAARGQGRGEGSGPGPGARGPRYRPRPRPRAQGPGGPGQYMAVPPHTPALPRVRGPHREGAHPLSNQPLEDRPLTLRRGSGPDRTGPGRPDRPDRTGSDRTGPDRTGRIGPDRTGPDRTGGVSAPRKTVKEFVARQPTRHAWAHEPRRRVDLKYSLPSHCPLMVEILAAVSLPSHG